MILWWSFSCHLFWFLVNLRLKCRSFRIIEQSTHLIRSWYSPSYILICRVLLIIDDMFIIPLLRIGPYFSAFKKSFTFLVNIWCPESRTHLWFCLFFYSLDLFLSLHIFKPSLVFEELVHATRRCLLGENLWLKFAFLYFLLWLHLLHELYFLPFFVFE